jgi:hypothetical protein
MLHAVSAKEQHSRSANDTNHVEYRKRMLYRRLQWPPRRHKNMKTKDFLVLFCGLFVAIPQCVTES